jgi:hypothetical protein
MTTHSPASATTRMMMPRCRRFFFITLKSVDRWQQAVSGYRQSEFVGYQAVGLRD